MFLLLLFLLLQLALLDTAELGLADAPSLADGLQQSGPATRGVNHFLGSSLDWSWRWGRVQGKMAAQAELGCGTVLPSLSFWGSRGALGSPAARRG